MDGLYIATVTKADVAATDNSGCLLDIDLRLDDVPTLDRDGLLDTRAGSGAGIGLGRPASGPLIDGVLQVFGASRLSGLVGKRCFAVVWGMILRTLVPIEPNKPVLELREVQIEGELEEFAP